MMLNLFYRPQRSSRHPKLYITDKKKRRNQKSKRKQTLVTKCHELAQLTGASVFLKIVCQDSNKSYVYATDDLYYEYSSRGLTKTGQVTKENREFGEYPPVNFNENNPVLLSPMKMKKAPKCILPGDLSNITVYYDVADSFADVVCEEETPNIEEIQPTMNPTTELEDSEPNQLPQEPSHPDPLEVPDNCDLESPTKELPEEEENYQPTSPLRVESTPQRSSKRPRTMTLKALDYHFNRVEVPLTPINKVCDMARPSASSDDQNKTCSFCLLSQGEERANKIRKQWVTCSGLCYSSMHVTCLPKNHPRPKKNAPFLCPVCVI